MTRSILMAALLILSADLVLAQQQKGRIVFERVTQIKIAIATTNGEPNEALQNMLPKTRTDRFELSFNNGQSIWKQLEDEQPDGDNAIFNNGGGGMMIRTMSVGSEDVTFSNIETGRKIELRELGTKKYIVEDSLLKLKWKLSEETKTILGQLCRKATSERISTRMMMNMDNGKMERKEVADTTQITAWFSMSIPVSAGPAEFQGQLPGMILELENGRSHFAAVEISEKVDLASIKEPKGPKRITTAEFNKERDKMFEEMGRNSGGGAGRTVIRIGN